MRSRCCVCVCESPLIVARRRLGKNPPIVARQRLRRNVTAITNTQATIEELLDASFSCGPCRIKESRRLVLHRTCLKKRNGLVSFEVLTAVVMKSFIFWDITPFSPVEVKRRFGETYCLHLQCRRVSQTSGQPEAGSKQSEI
jgi:hypothetical protein